MAGAFFAEVKLHDKEAAGAVIAIKAAWHAGLDKDLLQSAGSSRYRNSHKDREKRVASTAALNMKVHHRPTLDPIRRVSGPLQIGQQWLTPAKIPQSQLHRNWSG
jgi:hypothetical protein